jgi:hypothetical protein
VVSGVLVPWAGGRASGQAPAIEEEQEAAIAANPALASIMFLQYKGTVRTMPRKVRISKTHPFTVTLPEQAVTMIDRLIGIGLHGSSRAEVARSLILKCPSGK